MLPLACTWELEDDRLICKRCGQSPVLEELGSFSRSCPALVAGSSSVLAYPVPAGLLRDGATATARKPISSWRPVASAGDLARTAAIITAANEPPATQRLVAACLRQGVAVFVVDVTRRYAATGGERVLRFPNQPGQPPAGWAAQANFAVSQIQTALGDGVDRFVLLDNELQPSESFFAGLIAAEHSTGASLVSPTAMGRQISPQPWFEPAGVCDPACVSIHRRVFEIAGEFDAVAFDHLPNEALIDLCFRARELGLTAVSTRAAVATRYVAPHEAVVSQPTNGHAGHHRMQDRLTEKWGLAWADSLAALGTIPNCVVYTCRDEPSSPVLVPAGWRFVSFTSSSSPARGAWELRARNESIDWHRLNADRLFPDAQVSIWVDPTVKYLADWPSLFWHLGSFCLASHAHGDHVLLRRHGHPDFSKLQDEWRRAPDLSSRAVTDRLGLPIGTIRDSLPQYSWLEARA